MLEPRVILAAIATRKERRRDKPESLGESIIVESAVK